MRINIHFVLAIREEIARSFEIDATSPDLTPEELKTMRSASFMFLMGPMIHPCENNG